MHLKILTLNCQKGYRPEFLPFLERTLASGRYDLVLLQELHGNDAPIVARMHEQYVLLRARNEPVGAWSQVAVLLAKEFEVEDLRFHDFVRFRRSNIYRPEFGLLLARLRAAQERLVVGSVHANALLNPSIRKHELLFSKEKVAKYNSKSWASGSSSTGTCRRSAFAAKSRSSTGTRSRRTPRRWIPWPSGRPISGSVRITSTPTSPSSTGSAATTAAIRKTF